MESSDNQYQSVGWFQAIIIVNNNFIQASSIVLGYIDSNHSRQYFALLCSP